MGGILSGVGGTGKRNAETSSAEETRMKGIVALSRARANCSSAVFDWFFILLEDPTHSARYDGNACREIHF